MGSHESESAMSFPPPSPEVLATQRVAARLVELCSAGRHAEAMRELYADDARQVEAMEVPGTPYKRVTSGKAELLRMCEHWARTTTVHGITVGEPMINGDQFAVEMALDCTSNEGPMSGQRMQMREICLYTVRDGKITEAKFFYGSCGM